MDKPDLPAGWKQSQTNGWAMRQHRESRTPAKATKADMKRHEVRRAIENIKEDLELARESSL